MRRYEPSPLFKLWLAGVMLFAGFLVFASCSHAAEPTEAEQRQTRSNLAFVIFGASQSRQLVGVRTLIASGVPAPDALSYVRQRCVIDYDALVRLVLDTKPYPRSVTEVISQTIVATEHACPVLVGTSS